VIGRSLFDPKRIAHWFDFVKFLHAADIHLDSALAGARPSGAVPPHVTRDCTRRAFANLIDLAIARDVAFVIIAGDLYDGDWRDFSTGLYFAGEMRRLGRPCLLVRGNHDAASVISRSLEPPPNVRVFSERRAETFVLEEFGVALHGRSFPNRAVPEDLSAGYPPARAGYCNIGVLHTSADDPGEHATYAPCSVAALALKGYDYWALGHIHQRRELHQRPYVVFPGNIQGRHPNEAGAKGVTLVDVQDRRIAGLEHHDTDVLRWARVAVDATGAASVGELAARVRAALAPAHAASEGRPLIVRITLQGPTDRHASMLADPDALDAECRNAAASVSGDLHVERVRLETRMPAARAAAELDAVAQLAAPFMAGLDDPEVQRALLEDFKALAGQIPRIPGRQPPQLPQTAEDLRLLAPEAWLMVAQALSGDEAAP
jgi:DNA repair exonuclease SbcCD nuclease subunit